MRFLFLVAYLLTLLFAVNTLESNIINIVFFCEYQVDLIAISRGVIRQYICCLLVVLVFRLNN
jgi:hypothetical protein